MQISYAMTCSKSSLIIAFIFCISLKCENVHAQCTQGAVRLQGGISPQQGRLEICNDNVWGTVCNDFWDNTDAQVVCRQLGFPANGSQVLSGGFTPAGFGQAISLDDVRCQGNEERLIDCPSAPIGTHDCFHFQDVGVFCQTDPSSPCTQGDIRLQGGSDTHGRVEICNNNIWGTVCSDIWDTADALVACGQLGFNTTVAMAITTGYTKGSDSQIIWLDNTLCHGTETRLIDCLANPLSVHNCNHMQDAGVRCEGSAMCTQGDIRLQGGTSTQGRVEICVRNTWGTVCQHNWNTADATVACKQLGFSGATILTSGFTHGTDTQIIWLDNVRCTGSESQLIDCTAREFGLNDCTHADDAGVECLVNATSSCTQGAIRLQGTSSTDEGRVEICNNNIWGTVCDNSWGVADALVVCRQLGFLNTSVEVLTTDFTKGSDDQPIWLDRVGCNGREETLSDCSAQSIQSHSCTTHAKDAGVKCQGISLCTEGDIRLQGGGNNTEGRVEICLRNIWGTVCDSLWGDADALVACRQLGFVNSGAEVLTSGFDKGLDNRIIWMDEVRCRGTEAMLTGCLFSPPRDCRHSSDAGVKCQSSPPCTQGDIRLQGGSTRNQGRVEICHLNVWGTVCNVLFDISNAQVACRQLGYPASGGMELSRGTFTSGDRRQVIWLNKLECRGTEARLIDCPTDDPPGARFCGHFQDIGVRCQVNVSSSACVHGSVRLQGGRNSREGRVEICNGNVWGTVCNDFWDDTDAAVVCRQLEFSSTNAVALFSSFTNANTSQRIWFNGAMCRGTETRLIDCPSPTQIGGFVNCFSHSKDAGVRCPETICIQGDVRLQGGSDTHGRVEICHNNAWGTVCNNFWDDIDAQVVCRQLELPSSGAEALFSGFIKGSRPQNVWFSGAFCNGNESRLIDCNALPLGLNNCNHTQDAGVRCQANVSPSCTQGDIRLQGGSDTHGRVEICNDNVWGTVCDDSWGTPDAEVVCRELGYPSLGARGITSGFTDGISEQQIWLDEVQCRGNESRLIDCPANPLGTHNCRHSEDAGVSCQINITSSCSDGDVRLLGGSDTHGRVEICYNSVWGTVCDNLWGPNDAEVVCRQLGFFTNDATPLTTGFTNGFLGQFIWLDNVRCRGNETHLIDCRANELGSHDCDHSDDAGVSCLDNTTSLCTQGDIRLQGGNSTHGRVEICYNNIWGTVCNLSWGNTDARVACRQLGFNNTGVVLSSGFTNGTEDQVIWLSGAFCRGNESRLIDCRPFLSLGIAGICNDHTRDAGVNCGTIPPSYPCDVEGAIRLQGGNNTFGRVEICNDNVWGTVCDDSWGQVDAQIACRQLGFPAIGGVPVGSGFTDGNLNQAIWLDEVQCQGSETRLIDCPANALGSHDCDHSEDAGVSCQVGITPSCSQGDIRLQGGNNTFGRVEICNDNVWGTVCDDSWGQVDAQVACRQLGFSASDAVPVERGFTDGSRNQAIWLDDVQCQGSETRLIDCPANALGSHNCGHSEDAGVRCQVSCTQGDIRLQGGNDTHGRVEICNDNVWGTVCDDLWNNADAIVACRQLGFDSGVAEALFEGFMIGDENRTIWLSRVFCQGTESRLIDCPALPLGINNCSHREDAGVRCQVTSICSQGDIRLQGGSDTHGRVEICNDNVWGTVCDDSWGRTEAQVACKQLGFSTRGARDITSGFTDGTSDQQIWLDNVQCQGNESRLIDCPANPLGSHNCGHSEDAGVNCLVNITSPCTEGDIRLLGGGDAHGRVEICYDSVWGTVCDDLWGQNDAEVACRQLGFSTNDARPLTTGFTDGILSQFIWLDNVQCQGNEIRLIDCRANELGSHNCDHSEDAGISCLDNTTSLCTQGDIRLQGGNSSHGRVEICYNNIWGTVCNSSWDNIDARVACRQLGFNNTGLALSSGFTNGAEDQVIWLSGAFCRGNETRLIDCRFLPLGIVGSCNTHTRDAGVNCGTPLPYPCDVEGAIRLQGGNNTFGRVEICHDNVWGTVCDDSWGQVDAQIACRQLGFPGGVPVVSGFTDGSLDQRIWLDDVQCRGSETRLIDCPANVLGFHNCRHAEDAGVRCQVRNTTSLCSQGDIRLQGGSDTHGRVEICNNNVWGTVCDDSWGTPDAEVVCRQLGYPSFGAMPLMSGFINGDSPQSIWLDDVECRGRESRLIDCPASRLGSHNCVHNEDAGVSCLGNTTSACTLGDIRLQGGSGSHGRVEVCINNLWGTVCRRSWDNTDAQVACRQLGFPANVGVAISRGFSRGSENQVIWLNNVRCRGNESTLIQCSSALPGQFDCNHLEDAGVSCLEAPRPIIVHSPSVGNMLGGAVVFVRGFQLNMDDDIMCMFDDQTTEGLYVTENDASCILPMVHRTGSIPFVVRVRRASGSIEIYTSTFHIVSPDNAYAAEIEPPNLLLTPGQRIVVNWSPPFISSFLLDLNSTVDVSMYVQEYPRSTTVSTPTWRRIATLLTNITNIGTAEVTVPSLSIRCNYPRFLRLPLNVCPVAIKVSVSEHHSRVFSSVGFWTGIGFLPSQFSTGTSLRQNCEAWANIERQIGAPSSLRLLFPCPSNQALADTDTRYEIETQSTIYSSGDMTGYGRDFIAFFHPGVTGCYRQVTPERNSAGQQCCYGRDGRLVKGERAGGSSDAMSPKADFNRHLVDDLLPYVLCCKAGEGLANCSAYFESRPSGSEEGYIIPVPACVYGDPHIVTLDGHKYTFNGKGEFTLIETSTSRFTLQGRMEQAVDASGEMAPGTVFTAIVAREENTNTSVQFEVISNNLEVVVNSDQRVRFDDISMQVFEKVTLTLKGRNNISAHFSEGVNIEIKVENGLISVMLVSLPESMKGTTRGLMGTFNEIISDDLIPKSQEEPISLDSSITDIHNQFGLSWIIRSPADSLFTYAPGKNWSDFYAPDFVPMFVTEFNNTQLEEEAKEVCGDDRFCLFDIAATKRVEIGAATMIDGEMFDTIVEMAVPILCDPPCGNGVCIENNTCKCNEGFEGGRCTIPIMEECEVNMCGNNATCVKHVSSYTCECPSGFVGGLCEEEEPPFQIRLINSSPRVNKDSVLVDFITNKPSNSICSLRGVFYNSSRDCSKGRVIFSDLLPGSYTLRIISTTTPVNDKRATEMRSIHISNTTELCDVHLINEGVSVAGRNVTIQFYGSQLVEQYLCILDKDGEPFIRFSRCRSPLRYSNLNPGSYHLIVRPIGCGGRGRRLSENFKIDNN